MDALLRRLLNHQDSERQCLNLIREEDGPKLEKNYLRKILSKAEDEEHVLELLIEQLEGAVMREPGWENSMRELRGEVRSHFEKEEKETFGPLLRYRLMRQMERHAA